MQQICLTGRNASAIAGRLFRALDVQPVGLRIAPFIVDGEVRGHAVHLTPPTPAGAVPCRVLLGAGRSVIVPEVLEDVAAPGLLAALRIQAPVLIDGLSADLLGCEALRLAVLRCLSGRQPVIVTADDAARDILRMLVPEEQQLWFAVPEDDAGQASLLETLVPEAALRF